MLVTIDIPGIINLCMLLLYFIPNTGIKHFCHMHSKIIAAFDWLHTFCTPKVILFSITVNQGD